VIKEGGKEEEDVRMVQKLDRREGEEEEKKPPQEEKFKEEAEMKELRENVKEKKRNK